ncbi:Death domain-containing protein 1 [Paragonimus heterotremus]|uniref:Death domain-containing protein 1 n=1 Tax=Paragonimus heterotremus TaxID=100268 RepID=A0A8J4WJ14_9TREM|nr:Death domain-containing protein 1 [Paragonimus heterotremus]
MEVDTEETESAALVDGVALKDKSEASVELPAKDLNQEQQDCGIILGTVIQKLKNDLSALDKMSVDNLEQILAQFHHTFADAIHASELCVKEYINKAGAIETTLNMLAEYNKRTLEQLSNLTLNAIQSMDAPNTRLSSKEQIEASELLVDKAKLLVATAEKQFEYSKQIGSITRPLTLWRLDASKAVWEAHNALKLTENKYHELKERTRLETKSPNEPESTQLDLSKSRQPTLTTQPAITSILKASSTTQSVQSSSYNVPAGTDSGTSDDSQASDQNKISDIEQEVSQRKRQPIKFWPKHVYTTSNGEMICYIRAPNDCLRKKENLQCTFSDPFAPWPQIVGHTESIGRFVSIQPVNKRKSVILPNEPWIVGIPHNYGKMASKETVLYMLEAGPKGVPALEEDVKKVKQVELVNWRDLQTTEITSGDKHYLEARLSRLTDVTFAPCARLRRDLAEIGPAGGRLVSLAEPRISLTVSPGAVKVDLPFALQVQQLDYQQLQALKEHNETFMSEFISCSPLVYLTCAKKILFKPMFFTIPISEPSSAHILPVSPAMLDRINSEQRLETSLGSEEITGSYNTRPSISALYDDFQKSLVLPHLLSGRLMALKMRKLPDAEILAQVAVLLEQSLSQHLVYFALRQHQKQPHQLYLILALSDQIDEELQSAAEEGYKDGDKPHGPVFLREQQHIDIAFRSNIRLSPADSRDVAHKTGMKITFTSAVANRHKITVEPIDKSAQIGLDQYRGYLDIYCMREILTPTGTERANATGFTTSSLLMLSTAMAPQPQDRSKKVRFRLTTERTQLARIVVKLPKPALPTCVYEPRNRMFDFRAQDRVTPEYLQELAKLLQNDTWRRLGTALELSRGRLQAISGRTPGTSEEQACAMLMSWIKTLPISANRFGLLYRALQSIGRADLAIDLCSQSGYDDSDETGQNQ